MDPNRCRHEDGEKTSSSCRALGNDASGDRGPARISAIANNCDDLLFLPVFKMNL